MPFADAVVRLAPTIRFVFPIQPQIDFLSGIDADLAQAQRLETTREELGVDLIASQNLVSPAVLAAQGSVLTNKYAEGYPGRRYYGGCTYVDMAETLAIERAKRLFGADYANVQPHSGSTANQGVYVSFLSRGDPVLGMALSHGGHLTHGDKASETGVQYDFRHYGVDATTGRIDYDQVRDLARSHHPKLIVGGASAYSRDIDHRLFRKIADEVGAMYMNDMAHPAGLIAAGLLTSPVPHAHVVTTTTHKSLRGPRGGMILVGKDGDDPWKRTIGKGDRQRTRKMSEIIDSRVMPGLQGGPLMHVIAAKAIAFQEALDASFRIYAQQVIWNAQALADALIAAGYHVVSGGTDNHVFLVDLRTKFPELTGKEAEKLLGEAGITVNANTVPGETRSPFVTSGLRIGSPTVTTRGMAGTEMILIAGWIDAILSNPADEALRERILGEVLELTGRFPFYQQVA